MIKDQHGITLIELLVVAAIIMIMSALTIPNWNRGGERLRVVRSAHQLNQDIRRAQELTLANADFRHCATTSGYGLHFSPGDSYILFAECGSNNGKYDKIDDGIKEEIPLEEGVEIKNLFRGVGASEKEVGSLTVTFVPPNPEVEILGDGSSSDEGIIELGGNGFCRRVRTNEVGLVEIDVVNECE